MEDNFANYWRFTNNPTSSYLHHFVQKRRNKKGLLDKKSALIAEFGQIRGLMDVPYLKCILNILTYIIQMSAHSHTPTYLCMYRTDY